MENVVEPGIASAHQEREACRDEILKNALYGLRWHGERLMQAVHRITFYESLRDVVLEQGDIRGFFKHQSDIALYHCEGLSGSPMANLSAANKRRVIAKALDRVVPLFEKALDEQPEYQVHLNSRIIDPDSQDHPNKQH
jgi:hypothetical protein